MIRNRQRKKRLWGARLILCCALVFASSAGAVFGQSVTVSGQAAIFDGNIKIAQQQALRNAQRLAVEQSVGVLIDSRTETKNWRLLQDRVYTSSAGFIKNYKILEEGKSADGSAWVVKISARVAEGKIAGELQALNILQQKVGQKRFTLIYMQDQQNSLLPSSPVVLRVRDSVSRAYSDSGFRVFRSPQTHQRSEQAISKISADLIQKGVSMLVLLRVSDISDGGGRKSDFSVATIDVSLRVLDLESEEVIAAEHSARKHFTNARRGSYAWEKALLQAAEKSATTATTLSIRKVAAHYSELDAKGKNYTIIFNEYSEAQEDMLLDILENLEGFQSLDEIKNIKGLLSLEYFSDISLSDIRRQLRKAAEEQGIRLQTKLSTASRLVIVNPDA